MSLPVHTESKGEKVALKGYRLRITLKAFLEEAALLALSRDGLFRGLSTQWLGPDRVRLEAGIYRPDYASAVLYAAGIAAQHIRKGWFDPNWILIQIDYVGGDNAPEGHGHQKEERIPQEREADGSA